MRARPAEFIRRVEREFGNGFSSAILNWTGIEPEERLPPSTVRALCEQLGVPSEDFGVEPARSGQHWNEAQFPR